MKLTLDEHQQANIIKISAVITAMPRWVAALLASEGLTVPASWMGWWVVVSAIMGAGMAVIEGMAFAFVFTAWRNQKDKSASKLMWLALLSGVLFIAVAAPNVAASVRKVPLGEILSNDWMLAGWSVSVIGATISIVASVGYAQKSGVPVQAAAAKASQIIVSKPEAPALEVREMPALTGGERGTVEAYLAWQEGKELASAATIMELFHIPKRTAYNWRSKFTQQ